MKKIFVVISVCVLMIAGMGFASESGVPKVLSFQSMLFDDGGNPVADGDITATFRITNGVGEILYEEYQSMRAVGGVVNALIGNGVASSGAPAGPIPSSVFDAVGPFYLEVQPDGETALPAMEIASVPFAVKSETALHVAEGAVESASIADGGISFEDLSSQAVSEIANAITGGRDAGNIMFREDMETMYRLPTSAAVIGVKPDFIYSGSNNLQDVLKDFDRSIKARDERVVAETAAREAAVRAEITARTAAMNAEALARRNEDISLSGRIGSEAGARAAADAGLSGRIDSEAGARAAADAGLSGRIDAEVSARESGDSLLDSKITSEVNAARDAANTSCSESVASAVNTHSRQFASAWGSVDISGYDPTLIAGFNVRVERVSTIGYYEKVRVTFSAPMPNAGYSVVTTPILGDIPSIVSNLYGGSIPIYEKTADGFSVIPGLTFDFVVFGP